MRDLLRQAPVLWMCVCVLCSNESDAGNSATKLLGKPTGYAFFCGALFLKGAIIRDITGTYCCGNCSNCKECSRLLKNWIDRSVSICRSGKPHDRIYCACPWCHWNVVVQSRSLSKFAIVLDSSILDSSIENVYIPGGIEVMPSWCQIIQSL
jgi:hypothetical protein